MTNKQMLFGMARNYQSSDHSLHLALELQQVTQSQHNNNKSERRKIKCFAAMLITK